jgi:hypothetical protein
VKHLLVALLVGVPATLAVIGVGLALAWTFLFTSWGFTALLVTILLVAFTLVFVILGNSILRHFTPAKPLI